MSTINVQISKAKQELQISVEDFMALDVNVQIYILEQGFGKVLNAATSKLTKEKVAEEGLTDEQVADQAMGLVAKRMDELKAGKVKRTRSAGKGKVPGVVMTEARRLAKNIIKAAIKASGERISAYEPKVITEAANEYLTQHPEVIEQAAASIEQAKTLAGVADVSGIHTDAKRVAKLDAKKVKKGKSDLPVIPQKAKPPAMHATSH